MHKSSHQLFLPLITTFPENGEIRLKTVLDIYYFACYSPFRLVWDEKREIYSAQTGIIQQVICLLRTLFQLTRLLSTLRASMVPTTAPQVPGAMKAFFFGQSTASNVCGIIFYFTISSKYFQSSILTAVNLIKQNSAKTLVFNLPKRNEQLISASSSINLIRAKVSLYFFGGLVPIAISSAVGRMGVWSFRQALLLTWNGIFHEDVVQDADFPVWKIIISFLFIVSDVDASILLGCGIVLLCTAAKTVYESTGHVVSRLRRSKEYCVVSLEEVLGHFNKLDRLFLLLSKPISMLMFAIMMTGSMLSCIGAIFVILLPNPILTFTLFVHWGNYAFFLISASKAASQLQYISGVIRGNGSQALFLSKRNEKGIGRFIAIYEISSGSVGLRASDVFIVSYSFVGAVLIGIFSNTTIVMQSIPAILNYFYSLQNSAE